MSTLCAGCGHDSITAAIVRALWELSTPPHMLVKMSGIGCSSKTTAYFVNGAHGFNSAHGRMPPIATGANAANRELTYIGVPAMATRSLSAWAIFATPYGETSGWLTSSRTMASTAYQRTVLRICRRRIEKQEGRRQPDVADRSSDARLESRRHFLARSFSGDKEQLVPILKAALAHRGFALVDVISPCVTFNDHAGSTKSYLYTRKHAVPRTETDFVPGAQEIVARSAPQREHLGHDARRQRRPVPVCP